MFITYIVTSKPKRISVAAGVVHINPIANNFAPSISTIVYKQLLSNDLSYEINLSIIMIKNYLLGKTSWKYKCEKGKVLIWAFTNLYAK